jgi:hypothetical protein
MDLGYFMCSVSSPFDNTISDDNSEQREQRTRNEGSGIDTNASTASSDPELVESSCSSSSIHDSSSTTTFNSVAPIHVPPPIRPGETSPSTLLLNRRLSTGIATTEKGHPSLEGRPVIVQPQTSIEDISTATSSASSNIYFTRETIPETTMAQAMVYDAPHSAPPPSRPDHLHNRSVSEKMPSVAGLSLEPLAGETVVPEVIHEHEEKKTSTPTGDDNATSQRPLLRRSQTEPAEKVQTFRFDPPPLASHVWTEPPAETFQIRGKAYLQDRIKVNSAPSAFRLFAVDLVNTEAPLYSAMCAHPQERIQRALQREMETGHKELPDFVFCVNLCVPFGPTNYHSVYYMGADKAIMEEIRNRSTPFGRLMHQFLFTGSDDFRDNTFKLIPRIVEGNYIVRKAVGSKPSILGRKLKQIYHGTDRYMEVIVDIASDPIAQRVTKLAMGYLQSIVVDMMFVLEGNDEKELPERIFGGVRLSGVDVKLQGRRTVPVV